MARPIQALYKHAPIAYKHRVFWVDCTATVITQEVLHVAASGHFTGVMVSLDQARELTASASTDLPLILMLDELPASSKLLVQQMADLKGSAIGVPVILGGKEESSQIEALRELNKHCRGKKIPVVAWMDWHYAATEVLTAYGLRMISKYASYVVCPELKPDSIAGIVHASGGGELVMDWHGEPDTLAVRRVLAAGVVGICMEASQFEPGVVGHQAQQLGEAIFGIGSYVRT